MSILVEFYFLPLTFLLGLAISVAATVSVAFMALRKKWRPPCFAGGNEEPTMIHKDLENKDYLEWIEFLRQSENWSREADPELSTSGIAPDRHGYAFEKSAGYRERFRKAGVTPDYLRSLDDLRRFPFIEKEILRDDLEKFSVPMEDRTYCTTGGSTGIPLGLYRDPKAFSKELASKAYQYYRIGWKEGDRQFVFRGLPIAAPDHVQWVPEFNELRCSSYHLVPETMEYFYRRALEYRRSGFAVTRRRAIFLRDS